MRVTEIRYERVAKLTQGPGGFDNVKIAYTVLLEERDDPDEAFEYARVMVEGKLTLRGADIPPLHTSQYLQHLTDQKDMQGHFTKVLHHHQLKESALQEMLNYESKTQPRRSRRRQNRSST